MKMALDTAFERARNSGESRIRHHIENSRAKSWTNLIPTAITQGD